MVYFLDLIFGKSIFLLLAHYNWIKGVKKRVERRDLKGKSMVDGPGGENKWIQNLGSNPAARLRLFCFGYAGGSASFFRSWPTALPPSIEVCLVQLPGRENRYRENPFTDFEELITNLTVALRPALDLPFAFFGYSLGALIAFELARYIEQTALSRSNLRGMVVAACLPPQFRTPDADTYRLPQTEFIERMREMGGTPEQILANKELLGYFLPIIRADFELLASYSYRPGPPLNCPLTIFGGEQDAQITRPQLQGWQVQSTSPARILMFPGNHFFINADRQGVLQELSSLLNVLAGS